MLLSGGIDCAGCAIGHFRAALVLPSFPLYTSIQLYSMPDASLPKNISFQKGGNQHADY